MLGHRQPLGKAMMGHKMPLGMRKLGYKTALLDRPKMREVGQALKKVSAGLERNILKR
jgi:hypothetical protein